MMRHAMVTMAPHARKHPQTLSLLTAHGYLGVFFISVVVVFMPPDIPQKSANPPRRKYGTKKHNVGRKTTLMSDDSTDAGANPMRIHVPKKKHNKTMPVKNPGFMMGDRRTVKSSDNLATEADTISAIDASSPFWGALLTSTTTSSSSSTLRRRRIFLHAKCETHHPVKKKGRQLRL